ncbi:MAG: hypothetical protein H7838_01475 [Magnetococcus sp. DMHC-8]
MLQQTVIPACVLASTLVLAGCLAPNRTALPVETDGANLPGDPHAVKSPPADIPQHGSTGRDRRRSGPDRSTAVLSTSPLDAPIPAIAGSAPFFAPEESARQPLATYTLSMIDAPLREVLFALARDAELNLDVYPGIDERITINAVNQTLPAILDRIADQAHLQYQIKDAVIVITPDKPFRRSYPLNYPQTKRATQSGMSISTQMATAEGSADTGNGSKVTLTSSDTAVDFWDNLVLNILSMIESSDGRESAHPGPGSNPAVGGVGAGTNPATNPAINPATNPKVVLNRATGVVNVLATNRQHKQIQAFIDRVMRIAMRQVFIEATVVSVELSDSFQSGVDWSLLAGGTGDPNNSQSLLNKRMTSGPRLAINLNRTKVPFLSGVLGEHDLTATVRLLSQFGNAKVVSTPKVTVLNNQTAVLRVTTNQVYFEIKVTPATVQTANGGAQTLIPGTTQTLVRTAPVGFIMQVTPQIDDNDLITMNIRPTLQRISQWVDNPDPNMRTNQIIGGAFTPPPGARHPGTGDGFRPAGDQRPGGSHGRADAGRDEQQRGWGALPVQTAGARLPLPLPQRWQRQERVGHFPASDHPQRGG